MSKFALRVYNESDTTTLNCLQIIISSLSKRNSFAGCSKSWNTMADEAPSQGKECSDIMRV